MKYRNIEKISDDNVKSDMTDYNNAISEIDLCNVKISELKKVVDVMESYDISYDKNKIRNMIDEKQKRIFELKNEANLSQERIEFAQQICKHDMVNLGHDSHYDYFRCEKCGFEDRW